MTTPTLSTRLRAWRANQPCPHCAGAGRIGSTIEPGRECWRCRGTGAGLSQAQAAKVTGIPLGTWLHWEHSDRDLTSGAKARIEQIIEQP